MQIYIYIILYSTLFTMHDHTGMESTVICYLQSMKRMFVLQSREKESYHARQELVEPPLAAVT